VGHEYVHLLEPFVADRDEGGVVVGLEQLGDGVGRVEVITNVIPLDLPWMTWSVFSRLTSCPPAPVKSGITPCRYF
jgi:hypothetical protein